MLSCDFVLDPETSDVSVENVVWTPLVNHSEEGAYAVYALKDYSAETVARHRILGGLDDPLGQLRATTAEVIGDEFTIDM